jgi:hypothetical protein
MSTAVSLVGFGEAGQTFAAAAPWAANARAYDRLTDCEATRPPRKPTTDASGRGGVTSMKAAVEGAEIVLSLVTAGQALSAAISAARFIEAGALFCDMNSAAPATEALRAAAIEAGRRNLSGRGGHGAGEPLAPRCSSAHQRRRGRSRGNTARDAGFHRRQDRRTYASGKPRRSR